MCENSSLIAHIRETIQRTGPVTFAWFMEQALYHPEHGYYSSGRAAIGRGGDYFTSVSVGPLFGRFLAAQFKEMWELLGSPGEFVIVEQGAHGGELAGDVLAAARKDAPEFFQAIRYVIVEPFALWQSRQAETLAEFNGRVTWEDSVADLTPFRGVHFSNELIDAMPVHLVKWTGTEWLERHVSAVDDKFEFLDLPLSTNRLEERLQLIPSPLPAGYETEINLAALDWIAALGAKLIQGWILSADYGYTRDEFYAPHRNTGTLRAFARHQVLSSPLLRIGYADITAHVDWTSLAEEAAAVGLRVNGFADQHHFITGLLADEIGNDLASSEDARTKRALQTLLHPGFLGMKFQFLALLRNVTVRDPPFRDAFRSGRAVVAGVVDPGSRGHSHAQHCCRGHRPRLQIR